MFNRGQRSFPKGCFSGSHRLRTSSEDSTEPYTNNKENENSRNPLNGQKLMSSMHGKLGGTAKCLKARSPYECDELDTTFQMSQNKLFPLMA